jgi:hypothetical protein
MTEPVRLHPDNPYRLSWQGRARFLLGSTEHYGAVLNGAFDCERYLDTLAADGLSLTRAKCVYRELGTSLGGQLGHANTQAPRPEAYLAPWARVPPGSGAPGPDGLPRFDLVTWDIRFFARLRGFIAAAATRGIVVELVFFGSPHGDDLWRHFPLHPSSNVNGVGAGTRRWQDFMTRRDPSVTDHQQRMVRKVVAETNDFDNLYYEICNEPTATDTAGGPDPEALRDWQRLLVATVRETERGLPNRHLVAVNCHMFLPLREPDTPDGTPGGLLDDGFYRHNPDVDLINVHYLSHRASREGLHHAYAGAQRSPSRLGHTATFVALRRGAGPSDPTGQLGPPGKPIGFDEDYTGIVHHRVPRPAQNRMEAWESLLAGCATYDHLDFTFTTDDPTGSGKGTVPAGIPREWLDGRPLRRHFSYLAAYARGLDLAALRPDLLAVQQAPPNVGAVAARIGGPGQQAIAVYAADLRLFGSGFGETTLDGTICVGGAPPGAQCAVRALDPRSGAWASLEPAGADSAGTVRLSLPSFHEDVLLHVALRDDNLRRSAATSLPATSAGAPERSAAGEAQDSPALPDAFGVAPLAGQAWA